MGCSRPALDATYLWSDPDVRALLDTRRGRPAQRPDPPSLPGEDTLLGSWRSLARLSRGARLVRANGATAAVFPAWAPLNNAILHPTPGGADPSRVAAELAPVYAAAHVGTWALWRPSPATTSGAADDVPSIEGLTRDATTIVMQSALTRRLRARAGVVRTSIATATRASGEEVVPIDELDAPDGGPGLDGWALVVDARWAVAGAWSYLHDTDCGIYAVGTHPDWRRRGLARTLLEHVLSDARQRGARTASLQSTAMGLPLYESLGFTAVGRYEEWVPVR